MSFFCLCKASPDGSEDGPITRRRTAACNPEALLSNINTAALRSRPGRQVDLLAEARRPRSPPPFQMHQPGAKGNLAEQRLWTVLRRSGLKGSDSFLTRPGGSDCLSLPTAKMCVWHAGLRFGQRHNWNRRTKNSACIAERRAGGFGQTQVSPTLVITPVAQE